MSKKIANAKRSLGQNFLKSPQIAQTIALAGDLSRKDKVLEIGPGKGILTKELLSMADLVVAFEKDDGLYKLLKDGFRAEIEGKRLILINDDIFNIHKHKSALAKLGKKYKIVSNIPYNITGKLLRFIFTLKHLPELVVLLVQKEVAERIVAKNGKGSLISVSVKVYGNPKYVKKVPSKYFSPKPKVDSAIILIENINRKFFRGFKDTKFFDFVRLGFSHKRKLLKKNLNLDDTILRKCNIPLNARAEELSLNDWSLLFKNKIKNDNKKNKGV
jgi:16S rRNA (adenine1518-N6/adenine1519-N6)-dimethyltransferase